MRTARGETLSARSTSSVDMVKALHRADIEVILDVVFNHTTEGGDGGPTLCYRGFANDIYYILENDNRITPTARVAATHSTPTSQSCGV